MKLNPGSHSDFLVYSQHKLENQAKSQKFEFVYNTQDNIVLI